MKTLKQIINESLRLNIDDEPEATLSINDAILEIFKNFNIENPNGMRGPLTDDEYITLQESLENLFEENGITYVNEMYFIAKQRCIKFLPDDIQANYEDRNNYTVPYSNMNRLFYCKSNYPTKFTIFYYIDDVSKTLQIIFYRSLNELTFTCLIKY